MCFIEIIVRLILVYSDDIYIKTITLVSRTRTDLVHMLRD